MSSEFEITDFTEKEKVFDISLYKNIPPKRRIRVIANDLAGIVLEAGDRKLEERINPWYIAITPQGNVINLVSREEVIKNFGSKTQLARNETKGALDFYYDKAAKAKEGDVIIWFSPSGGDSPYIESRVNVAKVRTLYGLKILECYGIPSKLSREEILGLANYFTKMLEEPSISDPERLREIAIHWPTVPGQDVWNKFQESVRLDSNAWLAIASHSPRKIKREAYKVALPIARRMSSEVENAITEREFIVIGARAEKHMIESGWSINKLECPGIFNSDLLIFGLIKDPLGNYRKIFPREKDFEEIIECINCPFCKQTVRAGIKSGRIYCLSCKESAPYQRNKIA